MSATFDSDLIWHFTSVNSLYPILHDGLLATHQAFMNDTSDCILCRRVALVLAEIMEYMIYVPENELPVKYRNIISGLRAGTQHSIFLACFSAVVENPLLWRCYTSQGGFAIGVSRTALKDNLDHTKMHLDAFRFGDCIYDDWANVKQMVDAFEAITARQCVRLKSAKCTPEERAKIFVNVFKRSLTLERKLAFYKDPFFKGELEVRIMYAFNDAVPISDLQFLSGKPRILIPFKVAFSSLIKRIVVSPFGDKESNFKLAQLFAASIGLPLANVSIFEAPVR